MGTSYGRAIDAVMGLCTNGYNGQTIYQQPLSVAPLSSIVPTVVVADSYADQDSEAVVVVGRSNFSDDTVGNGTAAYEVLGRQRITERYTIAGFILTMGDGPSIKPVRDTALALYDGIVKLVWADPTLGGVLENGRIALVANLTLDQPNPGMVADSSAALAVAIPFGLQVENSYVP